AAAALAVSAGGPARAEIVELRFSEPPAAGSDIERTLASVVEARGIDVRYSTGGLYLITHYGDRTELFEAENRKLIEEPWIGQPWRFCSVYSYAAGDSVIVGRNWDNQNVGSIIVSLYRPEGGYASVSFCRAIDLGFGENIALGEIAGSPFGERLLLAPFYCMDGINERGLVVAVAGLRQAEVRGSGDAKPRLFISYLIRTILDRAGTVDEALRLAEGYVPFDLQEGVLNGHFFIGDASGRSAVLEYADGGWRVTPAERSWQVMTTRPVFEVTEDDLRESCWRYRTISEALERTGGAADWRVGMDMLRSARQNGTTWSVVYSPASPDMHFCVYQEWDTVYHLKAF
ncbi:MAG: linear amide C-N hydrolase, partial [Candidatus Krumholzibacteria bacterium]|nr:linear amide C-N hydrolase [Candidatus Krumholzibacteria bacterium]